MTVPSALGADALPDRSQAMSERPNGSPGRARPAAISPFRMRRVLRHVDENLHRRIGLQELATLAGLSPWYFCRAFKRETGLPRNRYILVLRLERACRLLSSPGARLADVAATVGSRAKPTSRAPSSARSAFRLAAGVRCRQRARPASRIVDGSAQQGRAVVCPLEFGPATLDRTG